MSEERTSMEISKPLNGRLRSPMSRRKAYKKRLEQELERLKLTFDLGFDLKVVWK